MGKYSSSIIKYAMQDNSAMKDADITPIKKIDTIIKRQSINYTFEQKYKLGIMTDFEFAEWQYQLRKEAEEAQLAAQESAISAEEAAALNEILGNAPAGTEVDTTKHTFWEGEEGDRENISNDAYEEFLKANAIDVSNSTSTSFDDLVAQTLGDNTAEDDSDADAAALAEEVARIQAKFMPIQGDIDSLFAMNSEDDDN